VETMQAFENESTADALYTQAVALEGASRAAEATEYYKRVYAIRERLSGLAAPKTLQSGIDVARCLSSQSKHRDALPYVEQAMSWIRQNPTNIDASSANSVKRLYASTLRGLGRLDEAAALLQEIMSQAVEGQDRVQTLNVLAGINSDMGKYPEALDCYWEAHELVSKSDGEDSEKALTILNNIAVVYNKAQYSPEEALAILRKVYDGYRAKRGETYPATISTAGSMVGAMQRLGMLDEAESLGRNTLRASERVYGEENQPTLTIANQLGSILNEQRKYEEAEELLSDCVEGLAKLYGANHIMTLTTRSNLAMSLRGKGQVRESLDEQLATHSAMAATLGAGHPTTRTLLQEVIKLQKQLRLFNDAVKSQEQLLRQMLNSGPVHGGHARCMADLIKMYEDNGDRENARAMKKQLEQLQRELDRYGA
jgi:tetratricopeptide (TPR) repeat protein